MLPKFLAAARLVEQKLPGVQFLVSRAASVGSHHFEFSRSELPVECRFVEGHNYDLMNACDLLLATSGTVTLEAAILGTPMLIANQGSFLTYMAFKALSKVKFLGLPNLLMEREICPELIQERCNPLPLSQSILEHLNNAGLRETQKAEFLELRKLLGDHGVAERISRDMESEFLK